MDEKTDFPIPDLTSVREHKKRRHGLLRRLCETKFGNGTGLLSLFGGFLVCLLGFLCHAKSPSVVQSFAARGRNANAWQSCPLTFLYGCPRQLSRKFRIANKKSRAGAGKRFLQPAQDSASRDQRGASRLRPH